MKFESILTKAKPVRRVVVELPQDRADALAYAISDQIVWSGTDVANELAALYSALLGIGA